VSERLVFPLEEQSALGHPHSFQESKIAERVNLGDIHIERIEDG
jgi:hypothetical protein